VTELSQLPTTESGHVVKRHSMPWLEGLTERSEKELKAAVIPKPANFSGSTYPTDISTILTGPENRRRPIHADSVNAGITVK